MKSVICRENHICSGCGEIIKKGESADYFEYRFPEYENEGTFEEKQIGIWFTKGWLHHWGCLDENGNPLNRPESQN